MIRFVAGKKKINEDDITYLMSLYHDRDIKQEPQGKVLYSHSACYAALLNEYRRIIPVTIHLVVEEGATIRHLDELQRLFPSITFEYHVFETNRLVPIVTIRCTKETPSHIMYRALAMARFLTEDASREMHTTKCVVKGENIEELETTLADLTLLDLLRNAYMLFYLPAHIPVDRPVSASNIAEQSAYFRKKKGISVRNLQQEERALCLYFAGEANYRIIQNNTTSPETTTKWPWTRVYTAGIRSYEITQYAARLIDAHFGYNEEEVK